MSLLNFFISQFRCLKVSIPIYLSLSLIFPSLCFSASHTVSFSLVVPVFFLFFIRLISLSLSLSLSDLLHYFISVFFVNCLSLYTFAPLLCLSQYTIVPLLCLSLYTFVPLLCLTLYTFVFMLCLSLYLPNSVITAAYLSIVFFISFWFLSLSHILEVILLRARTCEGQLQWTSLCRPFKNFFNAS